MVDREETRARIAIFGGGVAGLSVAHELIAKKFAVTVFEKDATVGGLARSQLRSDVDRIWPGEHGFRFYPAFYRNLIATLEEIPLTDEARKETFTSVDMLLTPTLRAGIADPEFGGIHSFQRRYDSLVHLRREMYACVDRVNRAAAEVRQAHARPEPTPEDNVELRRSDFHNYLLRLIQFFLLSNKAQEELDNITWMDWVRRDGAYGRYSKTFEKVVVSAPRSMVAIEPESGSACIIGRISILLFLDMFAQTKVIDRVLMGPTSEFWLEPWYRYLKGQGVQFELGTALEELRIEGQALRSVSVREPAGKRTIERGTDFDDFVLAVPLGQARELAMEAVDRGAASEALKRVTRIDPERSTGWMVGIQYFLNEALEFKDREGNPIDGHMFFPDSEWALTAILQLRHWAGRPDGPGHAERTTFLQEKVATDIKEILSVDVSDWNQVARALRRTAKNCTRKELIEEIWDQMARALGPEQLPRSLRVQDHLDEGILFDNAGYVAGNATPLLIHPVGDWAHRPEAGPTDVFGLYLAGDYTRTPTGLASMEAANESARATARDIFRKYTPKPRGPGSSPDPSDREPQLHAHPIPRHLQIARVLWVRVMTLVRALSPSETLDETTALGYAPAPARKAMNRISNLNGQDADPPSGSSHFARTPVIEAPPVTGADEELLAQIQGDAATVPGASVHDFINVAKRFSDFWSCRLNGQDKDGEALFRFVNFLLGFEDERTEPPR